MFTDIEIIANDYSLYELRKGMSLATYIKNILDSNLFETYDQAIDSVVSVKDKHSLISYCIFYERYEDAHFLKIAYEAIIIKGRECN